MLLPRILLCLACVASPLLSVCAQENRYATGSGRGLAIFQRNVFASKEAAVLFEYSTFKVYPNVTYILPVQGDRLTVDARRGGYLLFVPYPGRGEATPDEALAVLRVATDRFPQYAGNFAPLKQAWLKEKKVPPVIVANEIATRDKNKQIGEAFVDWLKSLLPKRQPEIPRSLLDPEPKPAPKDEVSEPPPAKDGEISDEQLLEKNLELIKKYYNSTKDLQ